MLRRTAIMALFAMAYGTAFKTATAKEATTKKLTKVKVLAVSSSLTSTPFLVAYANGMYENAGLDLGKKIQLFQGGSTKVVKALLVGEGDIATTGAVPLLQAIAAGAKVKIIAQMENQAVTLVLSKDAAARIKAATGVTPKSPLADKVRALKGLKIGTTPAGNQFYMLLVMLMNRYGVKENEVTLLPALTSTVGAGVIGGTFDGSFWGVGALQNIISDAGGVEWINLMTEHEEGISNFPLTYIFTTDDYIKNHTDVVKRFVDASRKAAAESISNPGEVMPAIRKEWYPTLSPSEWKAIWKDVPNVIVPDQKVRRQEFASTVKALEKATNKALPNLTYDNAVAKIAQE